LGETVDEQSLIQRHFANISPIAKRVRAS
jgi:hypothetical protein